MKQLDTIRYKIRCTWNEYVRQRRLAKVKSEIIRYYTIRPSDNNEITTAVEYLRNHSLCTFPADFTAKYKPENIVVRTEPSNGLPYVMHGNKKLFFKRSYRTETVKRCYCGLIMEQDTRSPHCYTGEGFEVEPGEVLFDVGSAEGIFALTHIETLKKVVFFERDSQWVEALQATFEPYKNKITIVSKFVSDKNDGENISIDRFLAEYPEQPSFIKIDVEGAEASVLHGMEKRMSAAPLKIAVCTYHQDNDYENLSSILDRKGFRQKASEGYMLFLNEIAFLKPPYFRKGLIRAAKSDHDKFK